MQEPDSAAVRAMRAEIKTPFHVQAAAWFGKLPPWGDILIAAMVFGMLTLLTAWEANNAGQGLALIAQGTAPWWFAYIAGAAVTIGVVASHRRGQEAERDSDKIAKRKWGSVTVALAIVSLFGVFSNLASKTAVSDRAATDNNERRAALQAEVTTLGAEVTPQQILQLEALIDANERIIAASLAEAQGWGMDDLDPDGACAADLRARQRQLCNKVNGSVDNPGVRTELDLTRAALEGKRAAAQRLEAAREELSGMTIAEGAEHWSAMSQLAGSVGQDVDASWFRVFGSFLLSVLILIGVAIGWDAALETRQELQEEEK